MVNEVILVGKIKNLENSNEVKKSIFIEIEKPFKNTYNRESDIIECVYWDSIFKKVIGVCKTGDMIAIKGRIENDKEKSHVAVEKMVLLNKSRDNILKSV